MATRRAFVATAAILAVVAFFAAQSVNGQSSSSSGGSGGGGGASAMASAFLTAKEISDLRYAFPLCLVDMPNETIQQPIVKISVNVTQLSKPGERLQGNKQFFTL